VAKRSAVTLEAFAKQARASGRAALVDVERGRCGAGAAAGAEPGVEAQVQFRR